MSGKVDKILQAFLPDYGRKLHVRQIARMVKINRQTASETLSSMERARILDSEISGRQKLYFINGSNVKAKIHLQNAENLTKSELCERKPFFLRLVEFIDASSVAVLFGSYAKGIEKKDSDIDLLVITDKAEQDFGIFEKETGKTVQSFRMNRNEFLERFFRKDHLVVEAVKYHVCLKNAECFVDVMWEAFYGRH